MKQINAGSLILCKRALILYNKRMGGDLSPAEGGKPVMKAVAIEKAVGQVLGQDLTQIVPGEFKETVFRKGHIVQEEDIPQLLQMGKHSVYIYELDTDGLHENDAAAAIAAEIAGSGVYCGEAKEGRVNIFATKSGLLKINVDSLYAANSLKEIAIATIHNNTVVEENDLLAAVKIIPLVVPKAKLDGIKIHAESSGAIVEVKDLQPMATSVIVTGNEVYLGRIRDGFTPVIEAKMQRFGCRIISRDYLPDDVAKISAAIMNARDAGAEMILVTGGMAVDPDDVTPAAIMHAGGRLVAYGTPLMPGAMFMLAYLDDLPIMGLPGCVMYHKSTIFDLMLPRILAGEDVRFEEIVALSHGGLCLICPECTYPKCHFGKA